MSVLATPTMSMKTSNLFLYTYDIDENKGSCALGWAEASLLGARENWP
jgi:hypothetical protein